MTEPKTPVEPVIGPALAKRFGWRWWSAMALALAGLALLAAGLLLPAAIGIGMWGNDIPYAWGFDIANYVWWVGIANGSSLFASLLVLRRHDLRTATNRFAEAMALASVAAAALFPVFHLGKPWLAYWMVPYPSTTGMWPQFISALTWDFWAILAHLIVTSLFWYVGLIPDLALIRDRARRRWARTVYGVLALGWRGSAAHWAIQQRAHRLVAISVIPIIFVMQSAVAFMLSTMLVPGWHDSRLPFHLCVTGFATGLAATLLLAHALREGLGLHEHVDDRDIHVLGKLVAAVSLGSILVWGMDVLLSLLDAPAERAAFLTRVAGPRAWLAGLALILTLAVPQLLWRRGVRASPAAAIAVAGAVLAGMWMDRLSIVADGLIRDRMTIAQRLYSPTISEWVLLLGSAGFVLFWLLVFARTLPVVSVYEAREDEHGAEARA